MRAIDRELELARKRLLDLTMRNRLLNFRHSRVKSLRIIDEIPSQVYDILVIKERSMEFLPLKLNNLKNQATIDSIEKDNSERNSFGEKSEDESLLWKLPEPDEPIASNHTDRFLQTSLEPDNLQKKLFKIHSLSEEFFEEQGYSILFLALGFLEWNEGPSSNQTHKSPLILLPVELERRKVGTAFTVKWTGDDPLGNISLIEKLKEQNISLPSFEPPDQGDGVDKYFKSISDSIKKKKEWKIVQDIYLDFFSFTKFVMYKDIDPKAWPEGKSPTDHPLIRALLDPASSTINKDYSEILSINDIDEKLNFENVYHVMDADPSQISVIEEVKANRNLVVEGPPGTGKSQTITNLIAELLVKGKSVLFVSEKMAALEVVKNRLERVGIGDYCLELHSRKTNKKLFLKELDRCLQRESKVHEIDNEIFRNHESLVKYLNDYVRALSKPSGKFGRSLFALYCMNELVNKHFTKVRRTIPDLHLSSIEEVEFRTFNDTKSKLEEISNILTPLYPIDKNPWRGSNPGIILPSDIKVISKSIEQSINSLDALKEAVDVLEGMTGIIKPSCLKGVNNSLNSAMIIASSTPVDLNVLLNQEWNQSCSEADNLINNIRKYIEIKKSLKNVFKEPAFNLKVDNILDDYRKVSKKYFRIFSKHYWQIKREISSLYKEEMPRKKEEVIKSLELLSSHYHLLAGICKSNEIGNNLFGSFWKAENSDPSVLSSFAEWIISFRKEILQGMLSEKSCEFIKSGISKDKIDVQIKFVRALLNDASAIIDSLFKRISFNNHEIYKQDLEDILFHCCPNVS